MKKIIIYVALTIGSLTRVESNQIPAVDTLTNNKYHYFESKVIEHRPDKAKANY